MMGRWSMEAIQQGAMDMELPSVASGMLPEGPFELVEFFMSKANASLARHLAEQRPDSTPLDPLQYAIQYRLGLIQPYLAQWAQVRMCCCAYRPFLMHL